MKDRYIIMRNKQVIDWQFMYDYVVSKGFNLGVEKFNIGYGFLIPTINEILDSIDCEYELTLLFDEQGNFIKVIN